MGVGECTQAKLNNNLFKDVRAKIFPRSDFFFKLLLQLENDQLMSERQNKLGVTVLVLQIKLIEDRSVSRSFGHVKRYRLHCY